MLYSQIKRDASDAVGIKTNRCKIRDIRYCVFELRWFRNGESKGMQCSALCSEDYMYGFIPSMCTEGFRRWHICLGMPGA